MKSSNRMTTLKRQINEVVESDDEDEAVASDLV